MNTSNWVAAVLSIAVFCSASNACPQEADKVGVQEALTVEYQNAPAQQVIKELMRAMSASYSLSSNVNGKITLTMRQAHPRDILIQALRQLDASCRIERGVYEVYPLAELPIRMRLRILGGPLDMRLVVVGVPVSEMLADELYLYAAVGDKVVKLAKKDMAIVASRALVPPPRESAISGPIVDSFDADGLDVREALRKLFRLTNFSYSIVPELQGTVTEHVLNAPFETVLRSILNQADGTFRKEGGVYQCVRQDYFQQAVRPQISRMILDQNYLFVSIGSKIVKLAKRDLLPISERIIGQPLFVRARFRLP